MKCRDIIRILAAGRELNAAAREHVDSCPRCTALLQATAFAGEPVPLPDNVVDRFSGSLTADLRPVKPIKPAWFGIVFLGFAILAAIVGVLLLGSRGWRLATPVQEWWILPGLFLMAISIPTALARLMVPGSLLRIRLRDLLALMVCWFALAAPIVYPVRMYPAFAKSAIACLFIGLGFAAAVAVLTWITLRGGFVTSPRLAALAAGALGGTSSLALQVIYCPHLDTGHFAIAHFGSFFLGIVLGGLLLWRVRRK
jgi:Negative regulator of sigma F